VGHIMSYSNLEEDLIAWNWAVAYGVELKGYRHLVIIYIGHFSL
jgi:hypothetical protein